MKKCNILSCKTMGIISILKYLVFAVMSTSPFMTLASVPSPETTIKEIYSYSEYGGGDVIFKTNAQINECDGGFWLRKTDSGFNANLSMIIAAYQAKTTVIIYANTNTIWPGSSAKYCQLYALGYL